jgi:hypothetical protein
MKIQTMKSLYAPAALAALVLLGRPAHADLVLNFTPTSAPVGGVGNFDITLTDTGGNFNVAGFSFEIAVASGSGITFTGGDMNTASPYIFNGNSFDAANALTLVASSLPATDIIGNDVANSGATSLTTGSMFALGDISYAVAPGTPTGSIPLSFISPNNGTSLSDDLGNMIAYTANNSSILVTSAAATPEPGAYALLGSLGLTAMGFLRRRRTR